MKKQTICTLLGISQEDAAMLFGVTRSHLAMFEIGQRDLPSQAHQLLAEMLIHVQTPEPTKKPTRADQKNTSTHLEKLLRENEYQQLLLAKKIATATKKQDQQTRLRKLTEFLNQRQSSRQTLPALSQTLAAKAAKLSTEPHTQLLTEYQHRLEILELEKQLLQSKLARRPS